MTRPRWQVARISDIEPHAGDDDHIGGAKWIPVRHHFHITEFGINGFVGPAAGEDVIHEHQDVHGSEELYLVTSGHATFTLDGEDIDAPTGTFVFCGEPSVRRRAVATEPGTTVVAIGAEGGRPFTISQFELDVFGDDV
jgi:quercetin dioxygenase-like cupin family protein